VFVIAADDEKDDAEDKDENDEDENNFGILFSFFGDGLWGAKILRSGGRSCRGVAGHTECRRQTSN